ncbi:MAG: CNNM domain-containing protein [Anaerolineae bacterium]
MLAKLIWAPVPPSGEVQGTYLGLITYILVALGFSFLCSVLEAVLLSTTYSHIALLKQEGRRSGRIMESLKENVEKPISAILTLNTIAHTVGAAGAGAQAAAIFGSDRIGIISAILTLLILVFSEIIPKTIGAHYWKQLTPMTAYTIQGLVIILYPAVWAFQALTSILAPEEREPTVTRSELEVLAEIGTDQGALEEQENVILRNLLRLSGVRVRDIMTPRTVLFALQQDMTVGEVVRRYPAIAYSRIPIFERSADDISAFVLRYDILAAAAKDQMDVRLKDLARPIYSVPESMPVADVLEEFIRQRQQIFRVFDEFGGTEGIITLEDAIELLLGTEITDESDVVADLQALARERSLRRLQELGLSMEELRAQVMPEPSPSREAPDAADMDAPSEASP